MSTQYNAVIPVTYTMPAITHRVSEKPCKTKEGLALDYYNQNRKEARLPELATLPKGTRFILVN